MGKLNIKLLSLFFSLLFVSCGTTQIVTSNNIKAAIYVNGEKKGIGTAQVKRMGIPKKINITAKYNGQKIGEILERRRFDGLTFLCGYFTTIGFLVAWRYPKEIVIPVNTQDSWENINYWSEPYKSQWEKPIKKIE